MTLKFDTYQGSRMDELTHCQEGQIMTQVQETMKTSLLFQNTFLYVQ